MVQRHCDLQKESEGRANCFESNRNSTEKEIKAVTFKLVILYR